MAGPPIVSDPGVCRSPARETDMSFSPAGFEADGTTTNWNAGTVDGSNPVPWYVDGSAAAAPKRTGSVAADGNMSRSTPSAALVAQASDGNECATPPSAIGSMSCSNCSGRIVAR